MKCLKYYIPVVKDGVFTSDIVRCSSEKAEELVDSGYWNYTSKKVWKRHGRKYLGRRRHGK